MSRAIHKLNARKLSNLEDEGWHGDGGGLWLRIKKSSKKWVFVWNQDKKRREMGLGPFRDVTLAEVREMAAAARRLIQEGNDPIQMRRDIAVERQKAIEEVADPGAPKFIEFADSYISEHQESWSNEKHRWQWSNCLSKHAHMISDKPVDAITADDVVDVLKPIWTVIAETAGRVRTRIEAILDAAKAQGHIKAPWENPARWKGNLEHRLPKRKRLARGHYSALPYEDMPAFLIALRDRPAPAARALEFTILCATRTNETLQMRWGEIDLPKRIWTIPAERMKMRVEHRIPLSDAAMALLNDLLPAKPPSSDQFVFPGQVAGKALSQMAMTMVMRSAFRDYMGDMTQHEENVIEHALAHQVGDSVVRAYRRKDAFDKRRIVMADWADYLSAKNARSEIYPIAA